MRAIGAVAGAGLVGAAGRAPDTVGRAGWVTNSAAQRDEVVAVTPVGSPFLGLAVDIGTTKIAAYLVDLATGRTLAKAGAVNPQVAYGEDVLSRISYAIEHADGRARSRPGWSIPSTGWWPICRRGRRSQEPDRRCGDRRQHGDASPVCRSARGSVGSRPVRSRGERSAGYPARDLGLDLAPGAYVHLPPNIAGYVGADHVAMAIGTGVWETARTVVAVDIGTNTEVTLAKGGRIWSCSCASGPAFEGAHIRDGMRAAPGAIERVQIAEGGQPLLKIIGDVPPVGICGSGIMDAISELLRTGIINRKGVFDAGMPRVGNEDGLLHYVLAGPSVTGHGRPIVVTRKDINEIQLAKAAIRVGVEVLLHEAGITSDADRRVYRCGRLRHLSGHRQHRPHGDVPAAAAGSLQASGECGGRWSPADAGVGRPPGPRRAARP